MKRTLTAHLLTLFLVGVAVAQPPVLVRDIETAAAARPSGAKNLVSAGGQVLFTADQRQSRRSAVDPGVELFATSGRQGNMRLVRDFHAGAADSDPGDFLETTTHVYFTAEIYHDENRGLFEYDKRTTDVRMLTDTERSLYREYRPVGVLGSYLIYFGGDQLRDLGMIGPRFGFTLASRLAEGNAGAAILGNRIVFRGGRFGTVGAEVWVADASQPRQAPVVLRDIVPGRGDSNPRDFLSLGGWVYFIATTPATGEELWRTDGTTAGTQQIADLRPGAASAGIAELTVFGSRLFFTADDGASGRELWSTDGQTMTLVRDIAPGAPGSAPASLTMHRGVLYFAASTLAGDRELWRSDGTSAGTTQVANLRLGLSSNPTLLTSAGNWLYFSATLTIGNLPAKRLIRTDGTTAGTRQAASFDLDVREMVAGGVSDVVMIADDGQTGFEVWASSGATSSTYLVGNVNARSGATEGSNPGLPVAVGNRVFFAASTAATGRELWVSDGTTGGTRLVRDIVPGSAGADPEELAEFGSLVVFAATDAAGTELWRSDGSASGTVRIADIHPTGSSSPAHFTEAGGVLYFEADDGSSRASLWRTDGTRGGTRRVAPLVGSIDAMIAVGRRVFLVETRSVVDSRLWASDGTTAGTIELYQGYAPMYMTAMGGRLFFAGHRPTTGYELFVSDGTTAGTGMVVDLVAGKDGALPRDLAVHDGSLYFRARVPSGGNSTNRMYRSDGTASGTVVVRSAWFSRNLAVTTRGLMYSDATGSYEESMFHCDFQGQNSQTLSKHEWHPNDQGSEFRHVRHLGGGVTTYVVRRTLDRLSFDELWATDGTTGGTRRVAGPPEFALEDAPPVVAGGQLFFSATSGLRGFELWRFDPGGVSTSVGLGCGAAGYGPRLRCSRLAIGRPAEFFIDQAPANATGVLLGGAEAWPRLELGAGCRLYLDLGLPTLPWIFGTGARGTWAGSIPSLPRNVSLVGVSIMAQAGVGPSAMPPLGIDLSNGVLVTVGQ